jgi:hypothetical protein
MYFFVIYQCFIYTVNFPLVLYMCIYIQYNIQCHIYMITLNYINFFKLLSVSAYQCPTSMSVSVLYSHEYPKLINKQLYNQYKMLHRVACNVTLLVLIRLLKSSHALQLYIVMWLMCFKNN